MRLQRHCDTACCGIRAHHAQMAVLQLPHDDVVSQVALALAKLEKVRVRWRRYPDTTPLASACEPVGVVLRSAQSEFAAGSRSPHRETLEALSRAITALRVMKREELMPIIESMQAACDAARSRNSR